MSVPYSPQPNDLVIVKDFEIWWAIEPTLLTDLEKLVAQNIGSICKVVDSSGIQVIDNTYEQFNPGGPKHSLGPAIMLKLDKSVLWKSLYLDHFIFKPSHVQPILTIF